MIDDNESYHRCNPDIQEIAKGEMVIFLEIFHDHGYKFKVKEENQNAF